MKFRVKWLCDHFSKFGEIQLKRLRHNTRLLLSQECRGIWRAY